MRLNFISMHPTSRSSRLAAGLLAVNLAGCTIEKDIASAGGSTTDPGTTTTGDDASTSDATTTDPTTGAPTTSDGTTTEEAPLTCPDHTNTDACCCFVAEPYALENVCGAPPLCDRVGFVCDHDFNEFLACEVDDEAALACTLSALADGAMVGSLRVDYVYSNSDGGDHRLEFHLQGDGTAYTEEDVLIGVGGKVSPTGRFALKDAGFFSECMAGDVLAKATCLVEARGASVEECLPGFSYEEI